MDDEQELAIALHDLERLAALESSALLDSSAEEAFDQFTRLASSIIQTPVALVSLVDRDRQFFKSNVGLQEPWSKTRQTPLSHSFCKHVVQTAAPLSVADAREHPQLRDNRAITDLGVIAYLGIPLTTSQGHILGSFCVIDSKPRVWTERETEILQDLANLVVEKIELRIFAKQLHEAYLELRKLELHRDEMLEMLVHDLRNPMSSFLSALELAQVSGELSPDCEQYVGMAWEGGKQLLQMVNNILDTSKEKAERLALQCTEVSAGEMIHTVCRQMAPLAEKSGVALRDKAPRSLLCQADAPKLRRVLVNLVSNAIQHTSAGGTIAIQASPEVHADVKVVHFSVSDTGHGIPKTAFERIFRKFGQVTAQNKSNAVAKASTGLGLTFSRMVVEAHGGQIWVESELSEGTCFHFTIPSATASL